ncbi:DUF3105 domain-containing protein [Nocardia fluminea]|uniref:DUF3105 domain-containing protein n=1 Tax=Nocardia fluminea TaxID=134984 RepID=UPI000C70CC07|nr:DUF3105 domain-containing protein [Nocardia fluminea]
MSRCSSRRQRIARRYHPSADRPHRRPGQRSGQVYTSPIRGDNAVHSLEHGAIWIT